MVSVSGIRGRVGDPLTPELVCAVAAAFGSFLREEGRGDRVVVGRDSRTSGPMLDRAAVAGLLSVGCDVVRVGVVPTPTVMLAVEHHAAAGGIAVTASHNPAPWNALKLATGEGMFLDAETSARFRSYLREEPLDRAPWDALGEVSRDGEAADRHLDGILTLPHLTVKQLKYRAFRVAVDFVHGAGATVVLPLLRSLGCQVTTLGAEPHGRFPRDPEPTAGNLTDLADLVRESGADVGLAVDPDADRLSLVDETGQPLGEDFTLALASAVVLRRSPGTVVTNLSTSQVVEDVARSYGGEVVRSAVGEINVARTMQARDAVVGGEGNGGVILPDLHLTRDAPVASALILQHLLDQDTPLSEAVARWPAYTIVKEKMEFPRESLEAAYGALEEDLEAESRDTTDGLRLAWPSRGSWLHVRPSGTEPVVRLIAEGRTEGAARELVTRARDVLGGTV